jgi:hypothetical protein
MAAVEAILAGVGLLALLVLIIAVTSQSDPPTPPPPPDDLAAPYREGLHAAVRLQRSAQDLEQQIWAEAAEQSERGGATAESKPQGLR